MLVCIQLEAFVLMTAMGLWLDVLLTTAIAAMSEHTIAYKTCSCLTVVVSGGIFPKWLNESNWSF